MGRPLTHVRTQPKFELPLEGGTKPNLAKLTIAPQIASVVLAVWRSFGF